MIKYTKKKIKNQELVELIGKHVSSKSLYRIETCCNYMELIADKDIDKKKMINGRTCKNRFCPLCAWRKAKKDAMIISVLMRYIELAHDKIFLFITLTVPNVPGSDLKAGINDINNGFKKLMKRKEFMAVNKGYIRKLEVTYDAEEHITHDMYYGNPKRHMKSRKKYYDARGLAVGDVNPNYNTYNHHLHIVQAVNKSYFKSKDYISQPDLLTMWREVMGNPNITQVDIRAVGKKKDASGRDIIDNCVVEVAKYASKDVDYLISQKVFDTFYAALKGAQIITYNGLFKDAMKLYKEDKLDAYKIVDPTEYYWLICNQWNAEKFIDYAGTLGVVGEVFDGNQYIETERRELTDEEKAKYNFKAVGELEELKDD